MKKILTAGLAVFNLALLAAMIFIASNVETLKNEIAQIRAGGGQQNSIAEPDNDAPHQALPPVKKPAKKEAQIDISIDGNGFSPAGFQIYGNDKTTITIKNSDRAPHSFTIDSLGINTAIDPGGTANVVIDKEFNEIQMLEFYSSAGSDNKETFKGMIMVLKR